MSENNNAIERIEHSLTLEENLGAHIRGWKIQRICANLILILLVLTALGLFGEGPLSSKKIVKNDVSVIYQRVSRWQKEMDVALRFPKSGEIQIAIPLKYLASFKLQTIVPSANESVISGENVVYTFKADEKGEKILHFYLNPQKMGDITGVWKVNQEKIKISHFIYP